MNQSTFTKSFFQPHEDMKPHTQHFSYQQQPQIQQQPQQPQQLMDQQQQSQQKQSQDVKSVFDVFSATVQNEATQQFIPSQYHPQTPQKMETEEKLDKVVCVFGFAPEQASQILAAFRQFGSIVDYEFVGNTNFCLIEYESASQTRSALRMNGSMVDEITMVGVLLHSEMRSSAALSSGRKSAQGGTPLSAIISPMKIPSSSSASKKRLSFGQTGGSVTGKRSSFGFSSAMRQSPYPPQSAFPTPSKPSMQIDTPFRGTPMSIQSVQQTPINDIQQNRNSSFTSGPVFSGFGNPSAPVDEGLFKAPQNFDDLFKSSVSGRNNNNNTNFGGVSKQHNTLYPSLDQDENTLFSQPFQPKRPIPLSVSSRRDDLVSEPKQQSIVGKIVDSFLNWG
ncbi:hypothetical protein MP638_002511 [Amoeboaphelidium occidentale]|nr:hypothetical protein MP638_002511 [Amoeboaphelidium occidentale]